MFVRIFVYYLQNTVGLLYTYHWKVYGHLHRWIWWQSCHFIISSIYIYIWKSGQFGKLLKSHCQFKIHWSLEETIFYHENDHKWLFLCINSLEWLKTKFYRPYYMSHITSFKCFFSLVNWHISQAKTFKYVFSLFCYMN